MIRHTNQQPIQTSAKLHKQPKAIQSSQTNQNTNNKKAINYAVNTIKQNKLKQLHTSNKSIVVKAT